MSEKISEKQKHQLPEYLRKRSLLGKFARFAIEKAYRPELSGRENIPADEPFLMVGNHFGGDDVQSYLSAFSEQNLHIAAAQHGNMETIWGVAARALEMFPVAESLSNLPQEEVEQTASWGNNVRKEAIEKARDENPMKKAAQNRDFIQTAVALLESGDAVGIFPEGVFTERAEKGQYGTVIAHQKPELRQGYRGLELIAKFYEQKTGKILKILPVAHLNTGNKRTINIGQPVTIHDFDNDNDIDMNFTDVVMTKVAELLPEEHRGYYADKIS